MSSNWKALSVGGAASQISEFRCPWEVCNFYELLRMTAAWSGSWPLKAVLLHVCCWEGPTAKAGKQEAGWGSSGMRRPAMQKQLFRRRRPHARESISYRSTSCSRAPSSLLSPQDSTIIPSQTQAVPRMMEFDHLKTNFLDLAHGDFWCSQLK